MSSVICPYCHTKAKIVTGLVVYPHRPDLSAKRFYSCSPCGAWVGCHDGTFQPLGRLADAELREAKKAAHAAFDPIWKARFAAKSAIDPSYKKGMARGGRYRELAKVMGIDKRDCHIGMFDVEQCQRVVEICESGALS